MTDVPLVPGHNNYWIRQLRNHVFLGKYSKWNLNFQNWSKALCLGVSEPTRRLAAQNTAYALRNRQGKQAFVKENEKKKKMKKRNLNL